MTRLLARHILLLCLAFSVSWWVMLGNPPQVVSHTVQTPDEMHVALEALALEVAEAPPAVDEIEKSREAEDAARPPIRSDSGESTHEEAPTAASEEPDQERAPEEESTPAPPLPEWGSPDTEEQGLPRSTDPSEEIADSEAATDAQSAESSSGRKAAALMADPSLLAAAALEIEGRGRKGFTTQLIAAPEDQIEIARTFGEELVLIPYRSVAPESSDRSWFRIAWKDQPVVERVDVPPPLSRYRQYRDLFDYEYSLLPASLRELRRAVLSRNEVYLFAALIPRREWALVIGRRQQALKRSGRSAEDVRTFRIRYRRTADSSFDVEIIEIIFSDGSRFSPSGTSGTFGMDSDQHSLETEKSL